MSRGYDPNYNKDRKTKPKIEVPELQRAIDGIILGGMLGLGVQQGVNILEASKKKSKKSNTGIADGYGGFWKPKPSIQHPLADTEIVEWDSTLAMVISKDDKSRKISESIFH